MVVGQVGLGLVEKELESSRLCDTLAPLPFHGLGLLFKAAGSTRNRCVRVHGKDQEEASYDGTFEGTEDGEQQPCP